MIHPAELLQLAYMLTGDGASFPPNEGQLRRAISTAYYALFHRVMQTAADRFAGSDERSRPAYALIYRGFNHGRMKAICQEIDKERLRAKFRGQLQCEAVSQELRDFVSTFVALQEWRHRADYDPQAEVFQSDALDACVLAEFGMSRLQDADQKQVADLLALMLAGARD
jgi:uncharacterized protein (UPF0332 family)